MSLCVGYIFYFFPLFQELLQLFQGGFGIQVYKHPLKSFLLF